MHKDMQSPILTQQQTCENDFFVWSTMSDFSYCRMCQECAVLLFQKSPQWEMASKPGNIVFLRSLRSSFKMATLFDVRKKKTSTHYNLN